MSNAGGRLGNFVQRKGSAPRPIEIPQRGEPAPPVQTEAASVTPTPAPAPEAKVPVRSLTLKLIEPEYELLREFAHRKRRTHQDVMREALMRYLQAEDEQ
jgi:hypothetical protein